MMASVDGTDASNLGTAFSMASGVGLRIAGWKPRSIPGRLQCVIFSTAVGDQTIHLPTFHTCTFHPDLFFIWPHTTFNPTEPCGSGSFWEPLRITEPLGSSKKLLLNITEPLRSSKNVFQMGTPCPAFLHSLIKSSQYLN